MTFGAETWGLTQQLEKERESGQRALERITIRTYSVMNNSTNFIKKKENKEMYRGQQPQEFIGETQGPIRQW